MAQDYISGKVIIVTGAGSVFGRLIAEKASARGAKLVCADINKEAVEETAQLIGGDAMAEVVDVTDAAAMKALATAAVQKFGKIDVMINNAGVMPLAFFADHETAHEKWARCIDINIKGVLNGMVAVYDQMIGQGNGHIINISSIYGNFPVLGAAVYGATKSAVNFLSESLRIEARGKIKVTIVKPTGVPMTGLAGGVVNQEAVAGILGPNGPVFAEFLGNLGEGKIDPADLDAEKAQYAMLDPGYIADEVLHAIDQPLGVSVGDITVRATGDHYVL